MRNSVKTQNQGLTSLICNTICNGDEMQLLIFFQRDEITARKEVHVSLE